MIEFFQGKEKKYQGYACDLSNFSLRFKSELPLRVGLHVGLLIHFSPEFSGTKRVRLEADIIRSEKNREGHFDSVCRFVSNMDSKSILNEFIAWARKMETEKGAKSEKRNFKRIQTQDVFSVEMHHSKNKLIEKGFGCDLSESGVHFTSSLPLPVGERVDLVLNFAPYYPGASRIKIPAKVIQCRLPLETHYYHLGCEFLNRSSADVIRSFLEWVQKKKLLDKGGNS